MLLSELRSKGLSVTSQDGNLYVEPASLLTDALRESIRRNKPAILRQLASAATERQVAAAASSIGEFRNALRSARLHVCCNCNGFQFAHDPLALGHCMRFKVEAWPFVPFWCSGFASAPQPVAPAFLPNTDTSACHP
jgi:hypothetical protein